ncbi:MAG: (2Fe-2S)-binding protein [Pyrinomonadaceae bacterium]
MITITINKRSVSVGDGTTVAAAVIAHGSDHFQRSVKGQPRGPLCGMGICFECRVTINGGAHQRSCNIVATEGMEVVTDE